MPNFSIKPNSRDRYSSNELRILGALRNGRCSTMGLMDVVYGHTFMPENASNAINAVLGPLRRKIDHNNEEFTILRNEDKGHREHFDYWLAPREVHQHTSTDENHKLEASL